MCQFHSLIESESCDLRKKDEIRIGQFALRIDEKDSSLKIYSIWKKKNTKRLRIINFFRFLIYYQEVVTKLKRFHFLRAILLAVCAIDRSIAKSRCTRSNDAIHRVAFLRCSLSFKNFLKTEYRLVTLSLFYTYKYIWIIDYWIKKSKFQSIRASEREEKDIRESYPKFLT